MPAPNTERAATSTQIETVDRWIVRACEALLSHWDAEAGNFWRDSFRTETDAAEHEEEDDSSTGVGKGATSNNRSFQALISAMYFFEEHDAGQRPELPEQLERAVRGMVTGYYTLPLEPQGLRDHGENKVNAFTDAQLLLSLCLAASPVTSRLANYDLSDEILSPFRTKIASLVDDVSRALTDEGVRVHESARPHQFLTVHSVRALDAAQRTLQAAHAVEAAIPAPESTTNPHSALQERAREEIVQQLGLHLLPAPGFDSSSLVSCCALLGRITGDADSPLVQSAIDALVADQSVRGTWTSAGVLSFGRRRLVYIPSVELSLVLANLALLDLDESETDIFERALPGLEASFRLVQSSYARHGDMHGWRNDRTRSGDEVESWTTAVVLRFLIAYRECLQRARQERILRRYKARRPKPAFATFWTDLNVLIPEAPRQRVLRDRSPDVEAFRTFSDLVDPTDNNTVVDGVIDEIITPTQLSVSRRPDSTTSLLLFGPPGTRKTSFVVTLAEAMGWPLITLTPPAFLRQGIEGFEAAAEEIFDDLMSLQRTVVLFDECEEFFRWRVSPKAVESRTVGAFITAGMLPRLQRLHDERWVVFVINTNAELFDLDDAITRRGRLDKAARLGHPTHRAQLRYLERWESRPSERRLEPEHREWFERVLKRPAAEMAKKGQELDRKREALEKENPGRGEEYRVGMKELRKQEAMQLDQVVTFSMLDALAARCLGEGASAPITSADSLEKNLREEFSRSGPDRYDRA